MARTIPRRVRTNVPVENEQQPEPEPNYEESQAAGLGDYFPVMGDASTGGEVSTNPDPPRRRGASLGRTFEGNQAPLVVKINNNGQPYGLEAKRMSRYIHDIMRTGSTIRLDHEKWKEVDRTSINRLLGQINDRFHLDVQKLEPWLIAKMNSIWVRIKCNIKKKHFIPSANIQAQYSKCPANFPPHQWRALVDYWRTSKAEKKSAQAIANRKKVKVVHRLGTDSYATKRAKMTMDNEGVEPSDFDLFIETHKEKENKQLDSSAKALVETMSQIPVGTPEESAREQALKAITGGPSHGRIPLQGLLPPSMVVLKQKAAIADSAMAAIEKANRDAADSQVQVQLLKERIDAMERAQKERDAGVNAFMKKYNLMDTDALARDDSDSTQGEYDVDSVQPT